MSGVRRSGRIAKEVPLLILGTDTSGRVFSEQTKTVVLSRHGAGIVSRHSFAPEEVLTLRFPESGQEADVRLVGKMGDTPQGHVYGVEFLKAGTNFWGMEFPGPEEHATSRPKLELECVLCRRREEVEQSEIEADVYFATEGMFRPCSWCGQTTTWRKAVRKEETRLESQRPSERRSLPPAVGAATRELEGKEASAGGWKNYRGTTLLETLAAGETPSKPAATPRAGNRRKHVRTRVRFAGCVRHAAAGDDIVECENVSKGGLCFRSRRRYYEGAVIEVAAPYTPGAPALFVFAVVKRVEELPGDLYRYGVAYETAARPW